MSSLSDRQRRLDNQQRNGVIVYNPGRPQAQPPRQRVAPSRTSGSERYQAQMAELSQASASQPQSEQQEGDDQPFWKQGLGFVIGNPVSQALLKPLEVADYGRRAVTLGVEEFAEGVSGALGGADELKAMEDDTRSNREKLNDPTYGVGQLLGDITGNKWADRAIGLIGDIALDPLTYVAGVGIAGKAGTGGGKLARAGDVAEIAQKAAAAGKAIPEPEIANILRKGWGQASEETLKMANRRGGVRIGTTNNNLTIPGSERLTAPISKGRGAVQDRLRQTTLGRKMAQGPEGLETPYRRMFFGEGPETMDTSLARVREVNEGRRRAGRFAGVLGAQAKRTIENKETTWEGTQVRKLTPEQQLDMVRKTEDPTAAATPLTRFFQMASRVANEQGVKIEGLGANYVPHIATPDARRWLLDKNNSGNSMWNRLNEVNVQLDKASGFTLERVFKKGDTIPLPDGTEHILVRGDISELNEVYREAGLTFNFYETNPERIMLDYAKGIAKDIEIGAGQERTLREGVMGNRLATELGPDGRPVVTTTNQMGKEVTESPTIDVIGQGNEVRPQDFERAAKAAGVAEADLPYFKGAVDADATKELNKRTKAKVRAGQAATRKSYGEARAEVNKVVQETLAPFSAEAKQADAAAKAAEKELTRLDEQLTKLEATRTQKAAALETVKRADKDLEVMGAYTAREGDRAVTKLDEDLAKLQAERAALVGPTPAVGATTDFTADAQKIVDARNVEADDIIKQAEDDAFTQYMRPVVQNETVKAARNLQKQAEAAGRELTDQELRVVNRAKKVAESARLKMSEDEAMVRAREAAEKLRTTLDAETAKLTKAQPTPKAPNTKAIDKRIAALEAKKVEIDKVRSQAEKLMEKRQGLALSKAKADASAAKTLRQQIADLDRKVPATQAEMTEVMGVREAAIQMRAASQTHLDTLEQLKQLEIPAIGKGETEWVSDYLTKLATINADVADRGLNATERLLQDVAGMLEDLSGTDNLWRNTQDFITTADKDGYGRVIGVMLEDGWAKMSEDLIAGNAIMRDDMLNSYKLVRQASRDPKFWPFIETLTNLFKTYATLSPGFHIRNALSASFMNSSDGVPLRIQAEAVRKFKQFHAQADPELWLSKQSDEWQQAFEIMWGSGATGLFDEAGAASRASRSSQKLETAFNNPFTRASKRLGSGVEGSVRLAPAYDSIRRGATADEALGRVTRLHFDYSMSSNLDDQMKRLIPFWTFMSRNLPMQITQMYTNPRVYSLYNNTVRNLTGEDSEGAPEYFKGVGAFRLGDTTLFGNPVYLQPDLAHTRLPEDISNMTDFFTMKDPAKLASSFNPLLTAPIEYLTKKDIFTGREFKDTDVREVGAAEFPIKLLSDIMGATKTTPGGKDVVPENLINALRAVNPLYDRAVRLAPQVTTGGNEADALSRQMESIARFLGAPIRQLTPQQQQAAIRSQNYEKMDGVAMQRALAQIDAQS